VVEVMDGLMDYQLFKTCLMGDDIVSMGMLRSCKSQIRSSNNMQNLTAKNSEYIGVKVAVCVLLLLLLLTWVELVGEDYSQAFGLASIDRLTRHRFPNLTFGEPIPDLIGKHVRIWSQKDYEDTWGTPRTIMYLDLNYNPFCNEIEGSPCFLSNTSSGVWGPRRKSLEMLDEMTKRYKRRWQDLVWIRYPPFWDADFTLLELESRVTSLALIDLRAANREEGIQSVVMILVVIFIIMAGIIMLTKDLTFLSKNLLNPLVELADEMQSITRLQLAGVSSSAEDVQLATGTSEVRITRRTFENLKKAIKSWGKYVPWPVVQLLLRTDAEASIDVQEKEVTIFFSDIASFTTIVEGLPPEQSLLLLSRYFHDMSKIIDEYGGIVLEFIGDAIMSIYGAPVPNPDHATAGVEAAVRMLAALRTMNEWFVARNLPQVAIRCGVHTGMVLVGNMGFESRMKYGAVGETSNVPAHLEEMNKNYETEMLISEATYSRIQRESFIIRPVDFLVLCVGARPEHVYNVMGRRSKDPHLAKKCQGASLHAEGMELYLARDFQEAIKKFEQGGDLFQEAFGQPDYPSNLMLKRCRSYAENPPPPTWDGVWDRAEKS